MSVAEQYVQAFSKLAKSTNTVLLPEKTGDISSMVGQVSYKSCWQVYNCPSVLKAMAIYGHMTGKPSPTGATPTTDHEGEMEDTPDDKLSDFEDMLDKLNSSINDILTQRFDDASITSSENTELEEQKDEPHFTLATSPTRNPKNPNIKKDDD